MYFSILYTSCMEISQLNTEKVFILSRNNFFSCVECYHVCERVSTARPLSLALRTWMSHVPLTARFIASSSAVLLFFSRMLILLFSCIRSLLRVGFTLGEIPAMEVQNTRESNC